MVFDTNSCLFNLYRNEKVNVNLASKFNKVYAQLDSGMVDELCTWICDMRRRYHQEGTAIFDSPYNATAHEEMAVVDLTG